MSPFTWISLIFRAIGHAREELVPNASDRPTFDPFGWKKRKITTFDKVVYLVVITAVTVIAIFLLIAISRSH